MAGALNHYAGGGQTLGPATMTPVPYYPDQGAGGSDPSTMAMILGAAGSAPPSPLVQSLMDSASELYGKPGEMVGALNSSRSRYNSAVSDKMAAINRAYGLLASMDPSGPGRTNLPLLAASAGLLQPTRTGTISESIGNAATGAGTAIDHQREIERALAQAMSNNDIEGGSTEIEGATGDNAMLNQRYGNADRMMGQAAQAQGREDLAHARMYGSAVQYQGRIDAATISANRDRYKFEGNDPDNPTIGRILDRSTGQMLAGPAGGGRPSPGGHVMTPDAAERAAKGYYEIYRKQNVSSEDPNGFVLNLDGSKADPVKWIGDMKDRLMRGLPPAGDKATHVDADTPVTSDDSAPPPQAPAPITPPPPIAARVAGKTVWVGPDGARYTWTGKGWKPQ